MPNHERKNTWARIPFALAALGFAQTANAQEVRPLSPEDRLTAPAPETPQRFSQIYGSPWLTESPRENGLYQCETDNGNGPESIFFRLPDDYGVEYECITTPQLIEHQGTKERFVLPANIETELETIPQ